MIRGATGSLLRSFSSAGGAMKRTESSSSRKTNKSAPVKLSIEMTHLIVKRCANEIEQRGLHEKDIFKPVRIGENADEIRELINCMLQDNRMKFEEEIIHQNIHNVVAAMKWALRHCEVTLVPYQFYEEFVRFEQEWDFDPEKGSFNQFLQYLPKQNQDILLCLFNISSKVTEESQLNQMTAEKIVKSLALCVLGDHEKKFDTFDDAYSEYSKCSNACLHLFLAYLREQALGTQLPPRLTILLDNYHDVRAKSVASMYMLGPPQSMALRPNYISSQTNSQYYASTTSSVYEQSEYQNSEYEESINYLSLNQNSNDQLSNNQLYQKPTNQYLSMEQSSYNYDRPISILRVTRKIPGQVENPNGDPRKNKGVSIILPELVGNIKRQTAVRASALMTVEEQRTAEKLWLDFQTEGIGGFSDQFLKLFFSLDDRDDLQLNSSVFPTVDKRKKSRRWSTDSKTPNFFSSMRNFHKYTIQENIQEEKKNKDVNESENSKQKRSPRPITLAWNNFKEFGFDGFLGNNHSDSSNPNKKTSSDDKSNFDVVSIERIEEINDTSTERQPRPLTIAWNNFKSNGFGDLAAENISDSLSLNSSYLDSPAHSIFSNDASVNALDESMMSVRSGKSRKSSSKRSFILRRNMPRRSRSVDDRQSRSIVGRNINEDLEEWHMIDKNQDLPTTHLAIEAIDEIFPYVWMERTTAEDKDGYWGDWVFIEPRKGLINECEWIMIEEQQQVFGNDWGNPNNYTQFSRTRSILRLSWFRKSFASKRNSQSNNSQGGNKRIKNLPSLRSSLHKQDSNPSGSRVSKKKGKKLEQGLGDENYGRDEWSQRNNIDTSSREYMSDAGVGSLASDKYLQENSFENNQIQNAKTLNTNQQLRFNSIDSREPSKPNSLRSLETPKLYSTNSIESRRVNPIKLFEQPKLNSFKSLEPPKLNSMRSLEHPRLNSLRSLEPPRMKSYESPKLSPIQSSESLKIDSAIPNDPTKLQVKRSNEQPKPQLIKSSESPKFESIRGNEQLKPHPMQSSEQLRQYPIQQPGLEMMRSNTPPMRSVEPPKVPTRSNEFPKPQMQSIQTSKLESMRFKELPKPQPMQSYEASNSQLTNVAMLQHYTPDVEPHQIYVTKETLETSPSSGEHRPPNRKNFPLYTSEEKLLPYKNDEKLEPRSNNTTMLRSVSNDSATYSTEEILDSYTAGTPRTFVAPKVTPVANKVRETSKNIASNEIIRPARSEARMVHLNERHAGIASPNKPSKKYPTHQTYQTTSQRLASSQVSPSEQVIQATKAAATLKAAKDAEAAEIAQKHQSTVSSTSSIKPTKPPRSDRRVKVVSS
ncbi:hypothetical protein G9A89_019166 [Geosiphon pyriformis]|nr:hypothetical protein G9A89_019166 [Geosiphon pyriformis]